MLACEVDVPGRPLGKALPAGEPDVLTRLPVRVRAVEERVEPRRRERGLPGPLLPDAGEDRLEPAQERLRVLRHLGARRGVRVGRRRREGARDVAARVVDEDPALPTLPPADVPRVLDAEVAVHVSVRAPPQSLGVPVAVGKLELELRVAAGAELRDRGFLQRREAGARVVERAQDGETHAEDHVIELEGLRLARSRETERHGPVGIRGDRLHRPTGLEARTPEVRRDRLRQLLVAAGDVEPLVRGAEDREVPRRCLIGEQVDQVERRLIPRLGAVLLVVGRVEEATHPRVVAACDEVLVRDPVVDRHLVEADPRVRVGEERRRVARLLHLILERLVDRLEVLVRVVRRVVVAEEPVRVRRAVRLGGDQVDGREPEALREVADRHVAGVDQLAAELRDLPVGPVAGIGVHAAAEARRRLVDGGGDALVGEGERRVQAGDAAADDCDPRRRRRGRALCQRRRAGDRDGRTGYTGTLQELTPGEGGLLAPTAQLGGWNAQALGAAVLLGEPPERTKQRRACHLTLSSPRWRWGGRSRISGRRVKVD